ncbi:MAG: AmmeMemoRadiSam system protein B [Desulfurococcaceae archaeon]|nr:AmmeMemoRadiSam system protein B [Desulfurococcaceae archaeon]
MREEETREPQASIWGFYPINKDKLLKEIERMFRDSVRGPGALPTKSEGNLEIIAGIVPHAGYSYSGSCAAWFYKKLAENTPKIDLAIILGTNHTGFGGIITTTTYYKKWSTPLGEVEVDIDFIEKLKNRCRYVEDDVLAHMREHSVEVQIPFLQYLYQDFKIVPIVVKELGYNEASEFARILYKSVSQTMKRCVVIASSDFTHHGSIYGYTIFRENISENVRKLDLMFIEKIMQLDTKGFLNLIRRYDATVCGFGAIAIAMEYAKLHQCKAELLKYYHSGDVTGEEDIVVGYAAIAFYRMKQ